MDGSRHCRFQTCSDNTIIETLPHFRGSSPDMELLRNSPHHWIRKMIANIFLQKKLIKVFGKVKSFEGNNAQNRRVDIIVIENNKDCGLILDPTIRLETNHPQKGSAVDEEKTSTNSGFHGFNSNTVSQIGKYLYNGLELSIERGTGSEFLNHSSDQISSLLVNFKKYF